MDHASPAAARGCDGLQAETLDQITLAHTAGYTRLGDWDYFSGMAEFAAESRQD